ncbi:hypothetical protein SASPL_109477 [Salvia splendens]|uniref:Serine/threonine-protein phosphatase 4 regulatory subunit 3 n=1 Tax=Salvia splendens TaxID=180675 RepID=A0A8X9A7L1_SALSN|nr:hypothetical protein SASPL_109477 [Salvia splendens]
MGSQDKSPNNTTQRVKVYRLNEDGKWDDQGTGHVTVDYLERSEDLGLFVIDEEDNETLLLHRISSDDIYRKQEDTIISWRDPEFSTELALSFQETTGCSYIWDHICSLQRNMHFNSLASETFNNINSELRELPPVELSSLPSILKIVECGIADQLRVTELILNEVNALYFMLYHAPPAYGAHACASQDFFRKLMELFRICEDLENIDGLHLIFKIVRGIILLNSAQIFEKIFGDELIMDIMGCLEYDPQGPLTHHRNFLKEDVIFKEVVPIKDPVVLSKIHQTYRVGYLKDVILPRALDEGIVGNLNSIIHSNNAIIISLLKDDSAFIKDLFARMKVPTISIESKRTVVDFLREFCTLSKSLQMVHQHRLFRDLVSEGIFDIIADVLQSEDYKLVLTGTDILVLFQSLDGNILRSYVSRQEGALLGLMVKHMLTDYGDNMHCQFFEILRSLLDSPPGAQRENIVEIFYEKHLNQLVDALSSCQSNSDGPGSKSDSSLGGPGIQRSVKPEILLNTCDLLCFCVVQHPYRIKCDFLLNNVIDKVLYLTKRREKYLVVAAIRFVRALVSRSDEHLMNHVVKNNLFKPIVDAFVANGDRYNLLNSAVLELFEYIRKENLKILLRYLVDTFWDQLAKFETLSSIHALKVKYEQSLENVGTASTGTLLDQRKRLDERALEKEEEDYFNEDSDEEDSASAHSASIKRGKPEPPILVNGSAPENPSPRSGGLVDYDDDEDDEDYRPPPKKTTGSSDEDGGLVEFPLKRKLVPKEDSEAKRLQLSPKGLKPRAVFCSTLKDGGLSSNKQATENVPPSVNQNSVTPNPEKGLSETAEVAKHTVKDEVSSKSCNDSSDDSTDTRNLGDERPLLSPKSSPEMAVKGS